MPSRRSGPPRYCRRAFPPYRFVPGEAPHPTRDPQGHSYGRHEPEPEAFEACDWPRSETYLYGVDLFNHGYWWEAHEAWEALWKAAGRHTPTGACLQGLIQVAVALLKHHQGLGRPARRLAVAGLARLSGEEPARLGLDAGRLREELEAYLQGGRAEPPVIVLRGWCAPVRPKK